MKEVLSLVFAFVVIGTPTWGQVKPEEVSKRMTSNLQKLREYSWSTQTEVSLKGQQISVTLEKLRYDLDGKLQIIRLGGTGKLSSELQPVVSDPSRLGLAYAQPDPQQFYSFFAKAEKWQGTDGTIRIEGQDFLRKEDQMDIRAKNNRADRMSVETVYKNGTPVKIEAEFRALPNEGQVVSADSAGRAQSRGKMSIHLTGLTVNGQAVTIATNTLNFEAEGTGKKKGRRLLGGAGIGAAIGAIADGSNGAWKGATMGAGVGGAATLLTKGNEVEFPAEQLFSFTSAKELKIGGEGGS